MSNISRSQQITRYSASGMECRGTCTIFLMQRIPYFPIQSWPWCLQKECWARLGKSRDYFEGGVAKRDSESTDTWSHSPFLYSIVPRIRPVLYPLHERNHHGRYDFRDGRHWPKFGTNRSNKDIFHSAFILRHLKAVNHRRFSWILRHYCFHKDSKGLWYIEFYTNTCNIKIYYSS